ncbi:unnamed protein product [Symbiodinium sp. CCMP2456]|nr:unnamed protein product [Symbiodinium sp. CCMP2456]
MTYAAPEQMPIIVVVVAVATAPQLPPVYAAPALEMQPAPAIHAAPAGDIPQAYAGSPEAAVPMISSAAAPGPICCGKVCCSDWHFCPFCGSPVAVYDPAIYPAPEQQRMTSAAPVAELSTPAIYAAPAQQQMTCAPASAPAASYAAQPMTHAAPAAVPPSPSPALPILLGKQWSSNNAGYSQSEWWGGYDETEWRHNGGSKRRYKGKRSGKHDWARWNGTESWWTSHSGEEWLEDSQNWTEPQRSAPQWV